MTMYKATLYGVCGSYTKSAVLSAFQQHTFPLQPFKDIRAELDLAPARAQVTLQFMKRRFLRQSFWYRVK